MDTAHATPAVAARKSSLLSKAGGFAAYLLARAPAEDAAAYEPKVLAAAAALAEKAVLSHRKGESVIAVDLAWVLAAAQARKLLRSERAMRIANRISAATMGGAAAAIAVRS